MLSYGSICTGIGGLDRGLHRGGITDLRWACERQAFRRRVIRRHWGADIPVHEDLEQLVASDLEPVDVLTGGTPCPDFSHAKAKREGLEGDKSRLFWDFMRVRNQVGPEWTIWENVDGALTTNGGLDFALVLGAFVGADVHVPRGGWPSAGVVAGPWGGAVWRVIDAQHFGTPQRRHRVFVVGRLGGPCPPEVLLEPAGRGGDLAPRDPAPEDVAHSLGERVAGTLGAFTGRGGLSRSQVIDGHGAYVAAGEPVVIAPDIAYTLVGAGNGRVDPLDGNLAVAAETAASLLSNDSANLDRHDLNLVATYNVATSEGETPTAARESNTAAALRAGAPTADPATLVVYAKAQKAHDAQDSERWEPAAASPTLSGTGGDANATLVVPAIAHALMPKVRDGDRDETYIVPYQLRSNGSNARAAAYPAQVSGALLAAGAKAGPGTTEEVVVLLIDGVRRLTPTECERIQGLPDGWTIPWGPSLLDTPAWHELTLAQRAEQPTPWDPPLRLDTPRRSGCGDAVNAAVGEWIARRLITHGIGATA